MPKARAASTLVVSARSGARCRCRPAASNQRLAERALVIVSVVVKVLEATRNSVLFRRQARSTAASSWPSTLETKWKRLPGAANSSASTAICGPRSEPPMPMLTTSVMAASARTCSAYASMASSVSCTSAESLGRRPAFGRRAQQPVQHGAVLGVVDALAGEHGVAVRSRPHSRASVSSSALRCARRSGSSTGRRRRAAPPG
jgi:hypothetical protein